MSIEQSREVISSQTESPSLEKPSIKKEVIAILGGTTISFRKPLLSSEEFLNLKKYIGETLGFVDTSIYLADGTLIKFPEDAIGQDTFTFPVEVYEALEKVIFQSYGLGSVLHSGHIEVRNRKMPTQSEK
ncbi:MAG: hypothetical protein AB7E37_05325 [Candidatus Altimarinota bacterium]